jgi:anti-anti-sigma factor
MEQPEEFSVSAGMLEGFRVVVVRGELDELTAPALDGLLSADGHGRAVIVDLTAVTFMSSAGIHALLRKRSVPAALVCRPGGNVARLLDLVSADRQVPLFDTLEHAVQRLSLSATG